jgi:hypothetical protein
MVFLLQRVFKKFASERRDGLTSGHGPPNTVPDRPQRQSVERDPTLGAQRQARRPTRAIPHAGDPERHLLDRARRWCMAPPTP